MKLGHNLTVAVGTAIVVAGVVALDWAIDLNLFNSGWGVSQSHAQTRPPAHAAPPAAQKQKSKSAQAPPVGQSAQVAPSAAPAAPAAPSAPVRTERIVYDSWTVTCTDTLEKAAKKTCSAMLQVVEEKQRQVLLVWIIGRDNQGVLRTVIQSPTGVQIPKGLELKFGTTAARTVPYAACTPQNCEASTVMDDAMVRDARGSAEATATIVATDGRAINFKMGIKGIDKAFAALGK